MLLHHDNRTYDTASKQAADWARAKLQGLISEGQPKAQRVIETIQREQPVDHLVRTEALDFHANVNGSGVDLIFGDARQALHANALRQVSTKAGVPLGYARKLLDEDHTGWGPELLATNLRRIYSENFVDSGTRFLLRSSQGQVRGFLSDRYRRLDSRPIVDAFAEACSSIGAVPVDGFCSDTKMSMKAMLPKIYEPVPNEVLSFGVALENSDYGNGALSLRIFCLRLWCTNTAIADEGLRSVHLGARLGDNMSWSNKTHRLDQRRMCSAISDVVKGQLSAARINSFQQGIRQANEEKIAPSLVGSFLKRSLTKANVERVSEAFRSADVENLPPGNTRWRLSNAISWVAGQTEEPEARLELMKLAGKVLPNMKES